MEYQHKKYFLVKIEFTSTVRDTPGIGTTGLQQMFKSEFPYAKVKVHGIKSVRNNRKLFHGQPYSIVIE